MNISIVDGVVYIDGRKFSIVQTIKKIILIPNLNVHDFKSLTEQDKLDLALWCTQDSATKDNLVFSN